MKRLYSIRRLIRRCPELAPGADALCFRREAWGRLARCFTLGARKPYCPICESPVPARGVDLKVAPDAPLPRSGD